MAGMWIRHNDRGRVLRWRYGILASGEERADISFNSTFPTRFDDRSMPARASVFGPVATPSAAHSAGSSLSTHLNATGLIRNASPRPLPLTQLAPGGLDSQLPILLAGRLLPK